MSLGAMMAGSQFANRVVLTLGGTPWSSTVAGTVYVTVITDGGSDGGDTNIFGTGQGGGGGGCYVTGYPITVSLGDDVAWSVTQAGNASNPRQLSISINTVPTLTIESGFGANNFNDGRGARGGGVTLSSFGTLSAGSGASTAGGNGSDGSTYVSGTIRAVTGGGGGAGNTVSPPANGGSGGAAGGLVSIAPVGIWGAAGQGYNPGGMRLTASTFTAVGSPFAMVEF